MMAYKYESVHEWLQTKAMDPVIAAEFLEAIIPELDADTIQNLFQNEMIADGFFDNDDPDEDSDDPDDDDDDEDDEEDQF